MLDPNRFALNAETVGFRRRMKQPVNMEAFSRALQTETDTIKVRRELKETPISEVHTMGAQLFGFAGNTKSNEMERQRRQINGYPLREWQQGRGPIVLPVKKSESILALPMNDGLVQYTQYNAVVGDYVSKFAEPNPDHVFGTVQDGTEHNVTMSQLYEQRRANVQNWQEQRSRENQNNRKRERGPEMGPPNLEDLQDPRVANVNQMGQNRGLHQGGPQGGGNGSIIRQGNQMQMDLNQQAVMDLRQRMAGSKIARLIDRKLGTPKIPEKLPSSPEILSQLVNNVPELKSQHIIEYQAENVKTPAKNANLAYGSQPSAGDLVIPSAEKKSPAEKKRESAGVPTKGGAALASSTAKSVTLRSRLPKSK